MTNLINLGLPLNGEQMRKIIGGTPYTCYCGFVGGEYENQTFTVQSSSLNGALNTAGSQCGGLGATCSGPQQ